MEPPAAEAQEYGTAGVRVHAKDFWFVTHSAKAQMGSCNQLMLQAFPAAMTPKVPPLQLPHTGVTWSEQLAKTNSLAPQASSTKRAEYKGRESVSMYLEDANKTMQVVTALRERRVFSCTEPMKLPVFAFRMKTIGQLIMSVSEESTFASPGTGACNGLLDSLVICTTLKL